MWQDNELTCFDFLKKNYSNLIFSFEKLGGFNSTESDIKVFKNGKCKFYIEIKSRKSQCGQFVLIPENNYFCYSRQNKKEESLYSSIIRERMNENYLYYQNSGTTGKYLQMDKNYFYEWIVNYYRSKLVKYFIFAKKTFCYDKSNFIIFPIEKIHHYCDVSAVYREKKSGSTHPSISNIDEIKSILTANRIPFSNIFFEDDKLIISILAKFEKFQLQGINYCYQFNPVKENQYEIRRLSNTKNSNVIFSLALNCEQQEVDLAQFESEFSLLSSI